MNQSVIEKAQELAQVIAKSPEFIAMRASEDAATQDEAMVDAFSRYHELHHKIEALSMQENPDFDEMGALTREMEAVQEEMQQLPLARAMQQAQQNFAAMMAQVNAELSKVLAPQSSCDGDCSGCGSSCGGGCSHCH